MTCSIVILIVMQMNILCIFYLNCALFLKRDQRRSFFDQGEMFYDANEQRIAYLVEVDTSRGKDEIYDLFLYKEVS